jgi:murein DD-endopeptidase MepM/ murein hydrolase activator NlpD
MSRRAIHLLPALAVAMLAVWSPAASLAAASSPQGEVASPPAGASGEAPATATVETTSTASGETTPTVSTPQATAPQTAPGATTPVAGSSPKGEPAAPRVRSEHPQGSSPSGSSRLRAHGRKAKKQARSPGEAPTAGGVRAKHKAPAPSTLTPALPFSLQSPFGGLPTFFIESFQIPPFLLPIFQAAGTAYGVPWQVLAAINEVETDYGRDLSVSSAGAEGWMQFLPSEWAQYGVDANGDGWEDPYNPADAIFAAARYLRAAGANTNVKAAVYAYNHSQAYVEAVMLRAQLLGGTPPELLGAITGLTEARFPVYAPSHYSDGFPTVATGKTLVGTTIYSQAGAPVIAVQDGEVVEVGESPSLGRFVALRDAYGNTYIYAELGEVAAEYPVLEPRVHSAVSARIAGAGAASPGKGEAAPSGPATAGAQQRSPLSEGAAISGLALGAAAGLEPPPPVPARGNPPTPSAATPARASAPRRSPVHVRSFSEGPNEVYLHPLVPGVQVIAGTVLGHVGPATPPAGASAAAPSEEPHIVFQIRPAGADAPLIDPKPILDGWVALEDTSIFRAKGENPFLATSPTVGQVLLESEQQLAPQVLHASSPEGDAGIHLGRCAREDVQEGRVDRRVLAMLEYLSVSGLRPSASGLPCPSATPAAAAANAAPSAASDALNITAINGIPIAGHQGSGSIADETVRKLLMLQGLSRPQRIISTMSYPGAVAVARASASEAIRVVYAAPPLTGTGGTGGARSAALSSSGLSPQEWIELIDRLGEIPDPTVASGHSSAAIPDPTTTAPAEAAPEAPGAATGQPSASPQGEAGGDD